MIGTLPVIEVRIRLLEFAPDTVLRLILLLVDVPRRLAPRPEGLCRRDMVRIGRPDEVRIADIERIPKDTEVFRHPVAVRLWRDALLRRLLEDLLPVLVGPDIEDDLIATSAREPREDIRLHRLERIAGMRLPVHVRQRRRDVEWFPFGHMSDPKLFNIIRFLTASGCGMRFDRGPSSAYLTYVRMMQYNSAVSVV